MENTTEIIIRTAEREDAALIANAISNGLASVGFDNVSTSIVGSSELEDAELRAAMNTINPDLAAFPVEIMFEAQVPAGSVDGPVSDDFQEPEEDEEEGD